MRVFRHIEVSIRLFRVDGYFRASWILYQHMCFEVGQIQRRSIREVSPASNYNLVVLTEKYTLQRRSKGPLPNIISIIPA